MLLCFFDLSLGEWSTLSLEEYSTLSVLSCFSETYSSQQLGYYFIYHGFGDLPENTWLLQPNRRHAMKIYSKFLPVDEYVADEIDDPYMSELILPHEKNYELEILRFSDIVIDLKNTKIVDTIDGNEEITLDTEEK